MSVAYPAEKFDLIRLKRFVDRVYKLMRLGGRDLVRAIVYHSLFFIFGFVGQRDEICSERRVCKLKRNFHRYRFERGATGVIYFGIVSKNREVCDVAAGGQIAGNGFYHAHFAQTGESVNVRLIRRLERSFAAKFFYRRVSRAVCENNSYFVWGTLIIMGVLIGCAVLLWAIFF